MKSTTIACAIGAILVSFGPATFAQGFERGADNQQRFEQREQRWHADGPSWDAPARGDGDWRRHSADQRFGRRAPRHEDQTRDAGWRDGREQLLLVQQEQRDEQPARGALTVIVQMPATPAVAVVGAAERSIIRPHSGHAVARVIRPVARRVVVAKAAACAAPGAAVAAKPRVAGPA